MITIAQSIENYDKSRHYTEKRSYKRFIVYTDNFNPEPGRVQVAKLSVYNEGPALFLTKPTLHTFFFFAFLAFRGKNRSSCSALLDAFINKLLCSLSHLALGPLVPMKKTAYISSKHIHKILSL